MPDNLFYFALPNMPIAFHTADIKFTLKQKRKLKEFITAQLHRSNHPSFQLSIVFTSDEYLRAINKQYLNHDYYTDIITFPLSEKGKPLEAEIYISIDRIRDNAQNINQLFENELHRVIFHGTLHLLGHKDKTKAQQTEMRKAEDAWLKAFAKF